MSKIKDGRRTAEHMEAITFSRPEHELLICCARTQLDDLTTQKIVVLLRQDLDWDYLIRLAQEHWILPLLYWNVNAVDASAVPRPRLEQLKDYFQRNAKRNLFLAAELMRVLASFEASGIRALPYKGPVLAEFAYKNVALRTFSDLDILIDNQDLKLAERQLLPLGFEPHDELDATQERIRLLSSYEYLFVNRFSATEVEIHWAVWKKQLAGLPPLSDLWQHTSSVTLFGKNIAIPSPEDLMLISAIHGTKHVWQKLQMICDVAELIRAHPEMNWAVLMERARALGNKRMLLVGLLLARDLLDSAVPANILQKAREDTTAVDLAAQIERRLFRDLHGPMVNRGKVRPLQLADLPFILRSKERFKDRARLALTLMLLPTLADYEAVQLPAPFIGLYLFVHPALILTRYLCDSKSLKDPESQA